jgi:hypothetical protein
MFEGCGFAILPESALPTRRKKTWVVVPIEGLQPRVIGVAQRRRALPGAPVRAVLEMLNAIMDDPRRLPSGVRAIAREQRSRPAERRAPPRRAPYFPPGV